MVIGGEHYFSPGYLFKKSKRYIDDLISSFQNEYYINFTFGGFYSLLAIIDEIKPVFDESSIVLLPSYLCPSILKPFKIREIPYKFYKVDGDLYIDSDHLISLLDQNVKAVFFINYFGTTQIERLQGVINLLKSRGIIIIQDVVQCLMIKREQLFGNYIFNSFRKFFPFEGSIILSDKQMEINFSGKGNHHLKYKRIGQLMRYYHINYNLFSSKHFLFFLRLFEDNYYSEDIIGLPKFNLKLLNKIDIEKYCSIQVNYYNQLLNIFGKMVPALLNNRDFIPLGFVLKIEHRDKVRRNLFNENIYPPIHWILSEEISDSVYNDSIDLSNKVLTIPLINLTADKFKYLSEKLHNNLNYESFFKSS